MGTAWVSFKKENVNNRQQYTTKRNNFKKIHEVSAAYQQFTDREAAQRCERIPPLGPRSGSTLRGSNGIAVGETHGT